jgi:ketosteroid isomerase-like protein
MSTVENKQLVEYIYTELSSGNVTPLLDSLAEEVQWTIIGTTELSGTYRGKREVVEGLLGRLRARLAGPISFALERFIAEGDHVVMQASGRATATNGNPYNNTYCIVCRIADGKIEQMTDYIDTALISSALFGAEKSDHEPKR